jgi:hypothetical protein
LKHKENGNVLIFNVESFIKIGKIYGKIDGIQTKLIEADAPDAPDALAENDTRSDSSVNTSEPSPQSESGESASNNTDGSKKVKCPECDYVEHPFYMKLHRKNTGHGVKPEEYKYRCSMCKGGFETPNPQEFSKHMDLYHPLKK